MLACCGAVFPAPVDAQVAAPTAPAEAARVLDSKRTELEQTKQRARLLETDVKSLDEERRKLNERLVETAALIQSSEGRMSAIEARVGELEVQEKLLRGSLEQRHDQIAKLLSALLRMGRNPPPVMITQREDALRMVRSAMLLAAAFPELRGQALALVGRLNELVRVMTEVRSESERLRAETQRLADAQTRLAGLMEAKKQTITERQVELEKVRKAAAEISRNVTDLGELISRLDQAVTKNTALAAYEEENRQYKAAAQSDPAGVGADNAPQAQTAQAQTAQAPTPAVAIANEAQTAPTSPAGAAPAKETNVAVLNPPTPSRPPGRIIELVPAGAAAMVPRDPGRIKPAQPFELAKARLPLPAQGRRVLSFGEKTHYGGQSKGMVLETRHGGQVTSPTDGWVVYAGEFRSYGQLLIINPGGGYHILLAGLSQIDVQPGQFVLAAEPVGTMSGAPRSAQGAASQASASQASASKSAPVLYIEFRKDGRPVDPDPWWVETGRKAQEDGQQKVQG